MLSPMGIACRFAFALVLLSAPFAVGQAPATLLLPNSAVPSAEKPSEPAPDASRFFAGSAGPYAVNPQDEPQSALSTGSDQLPAGGTGWFGSIAVGLVHPHVGGRLTDGPGLPFAGFDWTVMPRVEVGYRFADAAGDVRVGYRFLSADGTDQSVVGGLNSRVDLNSLDLDYMSREWLVGGGPDMGRDLRAVVGLRLADATVKASGPFWNFRSEFAGVGPRFGLEWHTPLAASWPVELYTRADATGLIGQTRQTIGFFLPGLRQWNGAAAASAEVGLGWRPLAPDGFRVTLGYQFEQWWNLSRTDTANADLSVHGVFLRTEWRY
jgi:Legionella pneumophila major outer membrane protein precursor